MAEVGVWLISVPGLAAPETFHVTPAVFESFATVTVIGTVCGGVTASMPCAVLGLSVTAIGGGVEVPHPARPKVRKDSKPESNTAEVTRFTNPP